MASSRSNLPHRLASDERGATAIEYGLIVSLIVIVMLGALESVADKNTGLWGYVKSEILESTEDVPNDNEA